jgi:hypothetical protein
MLQLFQTVAVLNWRVEKLGLLKLLAFLPPRPDIDIRYEKYDHDTTIPRYHGAMVPGLGVDCGRGDALFALHCFFASF